MKKLLLCLVLLLCGCTTAVNYDDVHQRKNPNTNMLPALYTKVSAPNLRAAFTDTEADGISRDERDIIVDNAISLFEREAEEKITVYEGERKGYISFKIPYVSMDHSNVLRITSMATLNLINFLGFPHDKITQTMEVEIEIMDKKRSVIKRYTEVVESSAYNAFYWGYRRKDINRKISADNVKKALSLISARIDKDASEIIPQLEKGKASKAKNTKAIKVIRVKG